MSTGWISRRKKKFQTTLDTYVKLKPSASFILYRGNGQRFPLKDRQNATFPLYKKSISVASLAQFTEARTRSGRAELECWSDVFPNLVDSGFDSSCSSKLFINTPEYSRGKVTPKKRRLSSSNVTYVEETPKFIIKQVSGVDKAVNVPEIDLDTIECSFDTINGDISQNVEMEAKNFMTSKCGNVSTSKLLKHEYNTSIDSPNFRENSAQKSIMYQGPQNTLEFTGNSSIVPDVRNTTTDHLNGRPPVSGADKVDEESKHIQSSPLADGGAYPFVPSSDVGQFGLSVKDTSGSQEQVKSTPRKVGKSSAECYSCSENSGSISPSIQSKCSLNDSILNDSYDYPKKLSGKVQYAYKSDVIRKKDERKKLCGYVCNCCKAYFDALNLTSEERERRIMAVSRHRDIQAPPATPDHFWEVGFPSTPELIARREKYYCKTDLDNDSPPVKLATNKLYTRKRLK